MTQRKTDAVLEFSWKDFSDERHMQEGIYLSHNGGQTFKKVHDLNGPAHLNGQWTHNTMSFSGLIAHRGLHLTEGFVIEFQQYDNYPAGADSGGRDDEPGKPRVPLGWAQQQRSAGWVRNLLREVSGR